MADFANTLAQMIASARPQHAPAPSKTPVIPGAGGMKSDVKRTSVSASANVDPLLRLFGYKTPEEKRKILSGIQTSRNSVSDEDWEKSRMLDGTQKFLASGAKLGLPVFQTEDGTWDMAKTTDEALARGLTRDQILAEGAGTDPRESLLSGEERLITKDKEMTPQQMKLYEIELSTANAKAENERVEKQLLRMQIANEKALAPARLAGAEAERAYHQHRLQEVQNIATSGLTSEQQNFVISAYDDVSTYEMNLYKKKAMLQELGTPYAPQDEYQDIMGHSGVSQSAIERTRAVVDIDKNPRPVQAIVDKFATAVQGAVTVDLSEDSKEAESQILLRQKYFDELNTVITKAGTVSEVTLYKMIYIGKLVGKTDEELVSTLVGHGFHVAEAQELVGYTVEGSVEQPDISMASDEKIPGQMGPGVLLERGIGKQIKDIIPDAPLLKQLF